MNKMSLLLISCSIALTCTLSAEAAEPSAHTRIRYEKSQLESEVFLRRTGAKRIRRRAKRRRARRADRKKANSTVSSINQITGDIHLLSTPPKSLELGALESDSKLFVFLERSGHTLSKDLDLDISKPGKYLPEGSKGGGIGLSTWNLLNPGTIPAGTRVDSYYFHFDNKTYNDSFKLKDYINCKGQLSVSGTVVFDRPILGIIGRAGLFKQASLRKSDKELGIREVDYCEHILRHFPGINIADGCGSDEFEISEDRRTLKVKNFTDIHHDNYRVILAAE